MKKIIILTLCISFYIIGTAQESFESSIEKVYVIFKTHFDLGYTELSSAVEQQYINNFIPRAIQVAEQLDSEGGEPKYIWTTGTWLIDAYMQQASPEEITKLEKAIEKGYIVWNATPYTIQSESVSKDMFETMLKLSNRLDTKYKKKTIAAKMTDVPGHTRSIITPLADAGIRLLSVGVNNCSTVPDVPTFSIWRNLDGKEIILMYQNDYGGDNLLPDGKSVVSINFTGDNQGPHTVEQVRAIYSTLRERYPQAEIIATSLNEVTEVLLEMADKLPVITSEIGDTWIYGYASLPLAMARYRELMRLYTKWIHEGRIDKNSDLAINFAIHLGLFAEHTWGVDHFVHIRNFDKYEVDIFNAHRDLPEFRKAELSWQEKANRIDEAIALLPQDLQDEAFLSLNQIGKVNTLDITHHQDIKALNWDGSYNFKHKGVECNFGQVSYQTYSSEDYDQFVLDYVRDYCGDLKFYFTKPGLEKTQAKNVTIVARKNKAMSKEIGKKRIIDCTLQFPDVQTIDTRVLPQQIHTNYIISADENIVEMTVSLVNKPAVRLPEAYWVSFFPADVVSIFADKMGMPVDVSDVVRGGNRQMHGIEDYFDIVTGNGVIRITSLDAPIASIGERRVMNYSSKLPDLNMGVHFCLYNNLWTTNFPAWWEGSMNYRFKIEYLPNK